MGGGGGREVVGGGGEREAVGGGGGEKRRLAGYCRLLHVVFSLVYVDLQVASASAGV